MIKVLEYYSKCLITFVKLLILIVFYVLYKISLYTDCVYFSLNFYIKLHTLCKIHIFIFR